MQKTRRGLVVIVAGVLFASSALVLSAATYNVPPDALPASLGAGDILNLGSSLPAGIPAGPGSVVNVLAGGGFGFAFVGSGEINVAPGALGFGSWMLQGGTLNADGGTFGPFTASVGSAIDVNGGNVLAGVNALGTTIDFHSGFFGAAVLNQSTVMNVYGAGATNVVVDVTSELNLRGGGLAPHPMAPPNSTILDAAGDVNLYVQAATLDGGPIPGLTLGATVIIPQRGVALNLTLADGTPFVMPLTASDQPPAAFMFQASSVLTVTLVPEPSSLALFVLASAAIASTRRRRPLAWFCP